MRIDVHIHHHAVDPAIGTALGGLAEACQTILKEIEKMNDQLKTAQDDLVATVAEIKTESESIKAYVLGQPDVIAAAVAKALDEHDVEETDAAATIEQARADAKAAVDDVLAAINNTGSDTAAAGGGSDSVLGGAGGETLPAGSGDDSVSTGSGTDSVSGGTGDDTVSGGTGNDSAAA